MEAEAKTAAEEEVEAKARAREATAAAALAFAVGEEKKRGEGDKEEEDYIREAAKRRMEREGDSSAGARGEEAGLKTQQAEEVGLKKQSARAEEEEAAAARARRRVEEATATAAALTPSKPSLRKEGDVELDDGEDASSVTSAGSEADQGIKEAEKDRRFKKPMCEMMV